MKINEEIFGLWNDQKKKDIIAELIKLQIPINICNVNKDYTVDVNGNVSIFSKTLEECPVEFNTINGNFIWHYANLKSLKNFPKIIKGNLTIASNKLTTLENSPVTKVDGVFNCSSNKLKNLNGSPGSVGGIICISCELESIEGSPHDVQQDFICSNNSITSLKNNTFYVGGTFDCSDNFLKDLKNLPPCLKIKYDNNPIDKNIQSNLSFTDFDVNDEIIYNRPESKYDKLKGRISYIEQSSSEQPEELYRITFEPPESPTEKTILHIPKEYLKKVDPPLKNIADSLDDDKEKKDKQKFHIDDNVVYEFNKIKYNGVIKKISNDNLFQVEFTNNIGVKSIYFLHKDDLKMKFQKKSEMTTKIDTSPSKPTREEKFDITDNVIYLDPGGRYDGCEGVISLISYLNTGTEYTIKVKISDISYIWIRNVKPSQLEKKEKSKDIDVKYKINDKIIYIGSNKMYSGQEGSVIYVFGDIVDIMIDKVRFNNIPNTSIRKKTDSDVSKPKPEKEKLKFKLEDKIVYVKPNDVNYNCRGKVVYLNTHQSNDTYDISIINKFGSTVRVNFVDPEHVKKQIDKFVKGEKIIYDNDLDKKLNKKIGVVKYVNKQNKYKINFNINSEIITISDVNSINLIKYESTSEISMNDDIIYTKIDSLYYGCLGVVTSYSISKNVYEIQIVNGAGKKIRIGNIKSQNLEKQPPKREFEKGDIIKYVNSDSPYNGLEGIVDKKSSKDKFDIILKNDKGNSIYLLTLSDNLILLEETKEPRLFTIGQEIIYKKEDSKYNNRIGEYRGTRAIDGQFELELKYVDTNNIFCRLWVEPKYVYPHGEPKPPVITTPAYDTNRKKKKKVKDTPRPPVLVYNRRNIARKSGRKPLPPPDENITED